MAEELCPSQVECLQTILPIPVVTKSLSTIHKSENLAFHIRSGQHVGLTIKQPHDEIHGRPGQHGSVRVQILRPDGRHHRVDDEPPAPAIDGPVGVELPLDLVSRNPDLRRPVAPISPGPDADDPSGSVHDGQRIVASLGRALAVKLDPERLGARDSNVAAQARVV